jgi:hypothetical protein
VILTLRSGSWVLLQHSAEDTSSSMRERAVSAGVSGAADAMPPLNLLPTVIDRKVDSIEARMRTYKATGRTVQHVACPT